MCFFVGNDFLPHLPSLEIREGAIDRLISIYKDMVVQQKGWLTENGEVFTDRVEIIMKELGRAEDEIFRVRQDKEVAYRANQKRRRQQDHRRVNKPAFLPQSSSVIAPVAVGEKQSYVSGADVRSELAEQRKAAMRHEEAQKGLESLLHPAGKKRSLEGNDSDVPPAKVSSFMPAHVVCLVVFAHLHNVCFVINLFWFSRLYAF